MEIPKVNKKYFNWFVLLLVITNTFFVFRFLYLLGPIYTQDTLRYIKLATEVQNGYFPHSDYLSPSYPFLLGITSNIFKITLESSLFIWTIILLVACYYVIFKLMKLIFNSTEFSSLNSYFFALIVFSNWVILKTLLTAHADALFLFVLLCFFYFSYLWYLKKDIKWFFLASVIAFFSIWVKLNGLVLIPFLIFFYFLKFYKKRLNYFYIVYLAIGGVFSFTLFKRINGVVISHFNETGNDEKILYAITNYKLFFANLNLSGQTMLGAFFSNTISSLLPQIVGVLVIALFSFLFFKISFFSKKDNEFGSMFLIFGFIYWLFLFSLQQYVGFEEINARTLFPTILGVLLWMLCLYKKDTKKIRYFVLILISFNVLYSFYFSYKLSSLDRKNCFNYVLNFKTKKSVQELKKMQVLYAIKDRTYTNEKRSLYYALNYANISRYPSIEYFRNGKIRYHSEAEFDRLYSEFCNEFLETTSALLLFDCKNLSKRDSCLITDKTKVFYIENDILLVNTKVSKNPVKTIFKEEY